MKTTTTLLETYAAFLEESPDFVISGTVFWQMHAEAKHPTLTVGGILLVQRMLRATLRTPTAAFLALENRWESLLAEWKSHWMQKTRNEYRARLRSWSWYISEMDESPQWSKHYPEEVHARTYLALLEEFWQAHFLHLDPEMLPLSQQLAELDQTLRRVWKDGPFLRPAEQQVAFSMESFWFLYGYPAP